MGYLNLNSISKKYILTENIAKTFEVFVISEAKLDSTFFTVNQFLIYCCKVVRRDLNRFGGGSMLYINDNIPFIPLNNYSSFHDQQLMAIKINQNKRQRLYMGVYIPPSESDK